MPRTRPVLAFALSILTVLAPAPAGAAPRLWRVSHAAGAAAEALANAAPGDTVELLAGTHHGPLRVTRRIVLRGAPGAVVDGGGRGSAIVVSAAGATVEDLEVRSTGNRVLTIDAAIQLMNAPGAAVRRVRASDVLYGIYAERSDGAVIEDCALTGRVAPLQEDGQGNGIHLWYAGDPIVRRNRVSGFTDGVYLSFVNRAEVVSNRLERNGRYGLHTMYCQESRLRANLFTRNAAGCAIMFTNHLLMERNDFFRNRGPRTYGILLRDCSDGSFTDNRMVENTIAMFMDNSNRNAIRGNLIQDNGWGLLIFSSCAGNIVAGNSFINNDYPVALDMSRSSNRFDDGTTGNYWSENAPYDLDGDGAGDAPFSPVTAFAFLSKQYPDLAVLAKSPAVAALGVAERVVPALRPSTIVDQRPRLLPAGAPGRGVPLERDGAPRAAWLPMAAFAALGLAGVGGLVSGRRAA